MSNMLKDLKDAKLTLNYEIKQKNRLIDLIDQLIEKERSEVQKFLKNNLIHHPNKKITDNISLKLGEQLIKRWDFRSFPKIIWSALFVSFYTILEVKLNLISEYLEKELSFKENLNDISGKGIAKSQKYLKSVCKIDFPDTSPQWNEIKKYNKLRNYISHNGIIITNDKAYKKIENYIKRHRYITDEDKSITLSKQYLKEVGSNIETFFDNLIKLIVKKYPNLKIEEL